MHALSNGDVDDADDNDGGSTAQNNTACGVECFVYGLRHRQRLRSSHAMLFDDEFGSSTSSSGDAHIEIDLAFIVCCAYFRYARVYPAFVRLMCGSAECGTTLIPLTSDQCVFDNV